MGPGCVKSRRRLIAIEQLFVQGAFGAHTTSPFNFEIEPENIILVALRLFEFPHGLGQLRTHALQQKCPLVTSSAPASKVGGTSSLSEFPNRAAWPKGGTQLELGRVSYFDGRISLVELEAAERKAQKFQETKATVIESD